MDFSGNLTDSHDTKTKWGIYCHLGTDRFLGAPLKSKINNTHISLTRFIKTNQEFCSWVVIVIFLGVALENFLNSN